MIETYSFTIPSLQDDTPLDCRIYHPQDLHSAVHGPRGAIIAHPYPPLGGTQDDHVVQALAQSLLTIRHIVVTFNFRGAGDSAGGNSWTGHDEVQDYSSVVGLLVYYLHLLDIHHSNDEAVDEPSPVLLENDPRSVTQPIDLLLCGYSYGSLILVRLPSITNVIHTFETAEKGSSAAEIYLRARALARQTDRTLRELRSPSTARTHKHSASGFSSSSSPITVGGEETSPAERRRRRRNDTRRRSLSTMREMPHRLRTHIRRHSGSSSSSSGNHHQPTAPPAESQSLDFVQGTLQVNVRYLLVSPVLFPLSTVLLPPGLAFHKTHAAAGDKNAGVLSLRYPTFIAFGDSDHFTSGKKLRQWAQRLAGESAGRCKWTQIATAGHFWREDGVLAQMEAELVEWIQS